MTATGKLERLLKDGVYPAEAARRAGVTRQRACQVADRLRATGLYQIASGNVAVARPGRKPSVDIALRHAQCWALRSLGFDPEEIADIVGYAGRGSVGRILRDLPSLRPADDGG